MCGEREREKERICMKTKIKSIALEKIVICINKRVDCNQAFTATVNRILFAGDEYNLRGELYFKMITLLSHIHTQFVMPYTIFKSAFTLSSQSSVSYPHFLSTVTIRMPAVQFIYIISSNEALYISNILTVFVVLY